MKVELCRKSIERLPPGLPAVLSALRDREHVPTAKDCLNRCQRCDAGFAMANADGMPLSAPTIDELLDQLDALAAEDA